MKIRSVIFSFFLLSFSTALYAQEQIGIIPKPREQKTENGILNITNPAIVKQGRDLTALSQYLAKEIKAKFGSVTNSIKKTTPITLKIDNDINGVEAYTLNVASTGIVIKAKTKAGIFNGISSLLQLLYLSPKTNSNTLQLPCLTIKDEPLYAWRGFMLDESRHFFGVKKVKQILDLMALHKLNKFHWHLTDVSGWRIEIKKYPKLTSVGAVGSYTSYEGEAKFYTQQQAKEIIKYAAERNIEVIPEIDMPGHASAAVKAYPEYSGGGVATNPNFTFNIGKEETYTFLGNILTEIANLFPSKYIHIGGDEVSFGSEAWKNVPEIIQLMKTQNFTTHQQAEVYFINRIKTKLNSLNKKMLGWDELEEAKVSTENTVLMWWRHDKPAVLQKSIDAGYTLVLCPRVPLYFDFKQDSTHKNGRTWNKAFGNPEEVYGFPESLSVDISKAKILGIQANLWTEHFKSENSIDYLMWPRLTAMAEAAWTNSSNKDYEQFKIRLKSFYTIYDSFGLYYFDVFDSNKNPEPADAGPENWRKGHLK